MGKIFSAGEKFHSGRKVYQWGGNLSGERKVSELKKSFSAGEKYCNGRIVS